MRRFALASLGPLAIGVVVACSEDVEQPTYEYGLFPAIAYSGFNKTAEFKVMFATSAPEPQWAVEDESIAKIEPTTPPALANLDTSKLNFALATMTKAGSTRVIMTSGSTTISSELQVKAYTDEQVTVGKARYEASTGDGRAPCASCHQKPGGVDHSPLKMAGFDDPIILGVIQNATYPENATGGSTTSPYAPKGPPGERRDSRAPSILAARQGRGRSGRGKRRRRRRGRRKHAEMRARASSVAALGVALWLGCSSDETTSGGATATADGGTSSSSSGSSNSEGGTNPPNEAGIVPVGSAITHGDQLTEAHVGSWSLQQVARGSEKLDKPTVPKEGFFRLGEGEESGLIPKGDFAGSDSDLAKLNDPSNHGGTLAADTMIDGFAIPKGTKVVQFRDLPSIYAQEQAGDYLFRGCRFRNTGDTFNMAHTDEKLHVFIHYSDFGGDGPNDNQDGGGFLHILGGSNHRVLRSFFQYVGTAIQPNVDGMLIQENFIDHVAYYFGEGGPNGNPDDLDQYHINGISSEGGLASLRILRNHITVPSPDGSVPPSYGAPNRTVHQTDCIALFQSLAGPYPGDDEHGIQVRDNYLGGSGYVIYGGGAGSKNVKITGNKISTRWWTKGGNFGPFTDPPPDGNGNEVSNNTWADDFGENGDGIKPTTARQFPNGDGPRRGQPAF